MEGALDFDSAKILLRSMGEGQGGAMDGRAVIVNGMLFVTSGMRDTAGRRERAAGVRGKLKKIPALTLGL